MKFDYGLYAALIATSVFTIIQPQATIALTVDEVKNIAQQITVRIGGKNTGSGVIIAREANIYYVLTAKHVVDEEGQYTIATSDGKQYPLNYDTIQKLTEVDLAVLRFNSNQNYKVATLSDYWEAFPTQGAGRRTWDESQSRFRILSYSLPITVFVSGWPNSNSGIQERSRLFSPGLITPKEVGDFFEAQSFLADGYEVRYSNITYPGMSGGPVLDSSGRVIAIHGRAEGDDIYELKFGLSFGIPISTFLRVAPQNRILLSLKAENSLPTELTGDTSFESLLPTVTPNSDAIDWANRGNQLFRIGRYEEAVEAYNKAVEIDPDLHQAWYGLGWLLGIPLNRYQEALASLNTAIKIKPDFYLAWLIRAQVLTEQGKHQEALTSINRAIEIKPDYYVLWFSLASILDRLKRYKEALVAYTKAIEIKPYALIYERRGFTHLLVGNGSAAIEDFSQALRLNRKSAQVYEARCTARLRYTRDNQGAIEDCTQALQLDPNLHGAYINRGAALLALRNYQGAIEDFNQALRLNPKLVEAYNNRGAARSALGDRYRAIEDFNLALRLNPNYANAYNNRAAQRYTLGDHQGAIEDLQRAATLFRDQGYMANYQTVLDNIRKLQQ